MNNIKVKICGVRTLEAAQIAVDTGADFLGFNFVPTSKRCLEPVVARAIAEGIKGQVALVGVFQNQSLDEVNAIADLVGLDYIQLHGEESEEYMKQIKKKIIKKFVIPTKGALGDRMEGSVQQSLGEEDPSTSLCFAQDDNIRYLILDREVQGQGEMVAPEKAKELAEQFDIFLAGGLTPENVSEIITQVQPFAVDVAGGVETDGEQDMEKIMKFIINAKGVTL